MYLWGIHVVDLSIIALYVVVMVWLGKRVSKKTRSEREFYLAGRNLGKFYQFFLNLGCSTNADQAVAVSREIYRQGIGGMWIQFLVLFLTPFYWFTTLFFRRVRLTTIGDYFTERYNSRFLGAGYAVFMLALSLVGSGVGYMVAGKTMVAMAPKPFEECTPAEQASIRQFEEFQVLEAQKANGLSDERQARYNELREKNKKGELKSFVSYISPVFFYFMFAIVVAVYTMLGGFRAAALTDAVQGMLIITFSVMLIPVGLIRIGGFAQLHAKVPDYMFNLFGSATLSEYAWYTVLAMVLSNLVSIVAVVSGMQTAGSARNEYTARIGMIGGMFAKRILMLFWALAGLLAVGMYAGKLNDPDMIWGYMTKDLLAPGAIGFMLVGVLAANMSALAAGAVSYAALFTNNLYKPRYAGKSDRHYLRVGRIVIAASLLGGIGVALLVNNLLELFQYIISIPAIFGASIWLGFLWRRVTRWAVIIQVALCIVIYAIIPNLFQQVDAIKYSRSFLQETKQQSMVVTVQALAQDVSEGRAAATGQLIQKDHVIPPVGILFERVARIDPENPQSAKVGLGRFHAEIWILSWFGIDFSGFRKSQLVAVRFFFDAFFPFVLLFLISFLTRPAPRVVLDRFFARLHTPVQPTHEEDEKVVAESYAHPARFEKEKLIPGSQWEVLRPAWSDYVGFGGCWLLVGLVIVLLWVMVSIR